MRESGSCARRALFADLDLRAALRSRCRPDDDSILGCLAPSWRRFRAPWRRRRWKLTPSRPAQRGHRGAGDERHASEGDQRERRPHAGSTEAQLSAQQAIEELLIFGVELEKFLLLLRHREIEREEAVSRWSRLMCDGAGTTSSDCVADWLVERAADLSTGPQTLDASDKRRKRALEPLAARPRIYRI